MDPSDWKVVATGIVLFTFLIGGLWGLTIYGDLQHIGNDKIYACPKGDWSGYTKDMTMVSDGDGRRNYYCPIDGAWIGWENDRDPLLIGQVI